MTEPLSIIEGLLAASLDLGSVRDVCFYAFSKRVKSDDVVKMHHPLPVVVVASLLEKNPGFAKLLAVASTGPPVESKDLPSTKARSCSIQQMVQGSEYDYDSDSDLDDEEQDNMDRLSENSVPSEHTFDLSAVGTDDSEAGNASAVPQSSIKYRNVMVPNIAFRTLRVGIFFTYTGKVKFLPLRSQGYEKRQSQLRSLESFGIPACSPKSLYRFADAFDMEDLRHMAANAIVHRLSAENIVEEAFSSFFCRYDDLHKRAMNVLALLYDNSAVQQSLQGLIPRLVKGELPHAGLTLVALLQMQKVEPSRRLARLDTVDAGAAAQVAPNNHDGSSPLSTSLNASAQSFRFTWPPSAPPAVGFSVTDPYPTRPYKNLPSSVPRRRYIGPAIAPR
ncbi:hypothetical protein K466DRAFT_600485 [Polyporus arcularius HHB13444]|uniref:BTB domain-containing protein n=1 Tax=Polyporus arcularius HHB13444 TaxID=1314778 RepID=A0A5C3PCB9_9APHY|nr:hypothetical protein K466DRAFT_600485 [Polyporus arcularius HHB13444]